MTRIDLQQQRDHQARHAALEAMAALTVEPTSLVQFASRGQVLVIGDMHAMEIASRFRPPLRARVLLTTGAEEPGVPVIPQGGRALRLSGHLGDFQIQLGDTGRHNAETLRADLVLDLSPQPLFTMPVPPLGYIHSTLEEADVSHAIATLSDMVGSFEKPKFFEYDAARCAHGRNGKTACTLCLDACPTQAITSLKDMIAVDSNLCQGGGICATVCPGGAIRYSYPGPKDTLAQLRTLLRRYVEQGGQAPVVAFFSEAEAEADARTDGDLLTALPGNVLPVTIEELASVGLEVWLAALAYGAQAVWLVDGGSLPVSVRQALETQLQTAAGILAALGQAPGAVRLITHAELKTPPASRITLSRTVGFSTQNDKRETAYLAIDHLVSQSASPAAFPEQLAALPSGAPFGEARVDETRCTLCMACVSACPGKALRAGQDTPQLSFLEANCLQCGMCVSTCPEHAVSIAPRLLLQREARNTWRVLHEEPPFPCVACGKPFATRSVITNMLTRLQGHAMFQSERARRRLMMCEDCRVVDVVQDPEAMEGGLGRNVGTQ